VQTLFEEPGNRNLLSHGFSRMSANKRYILWFWLLNVALATIGTSAFRTSAHSILDHSLFSKRLTDGFHLTTMFELYNRPEFGPFSSVTTPAAWLACIFFIATALFLPGIFAGYGSTYRLPKEDFFRACGRNLWRFIRLMIVAGIVMGIFAGLLFAANDAIVTKAGESTYEMLPFISQMIGFVIIFLVMTALRICFDLAEADIVLNDQGVVRKSIAAGFRHTFRNLGRLLAAYVLATLLAAIVLVAGLWCWMRFIPSNSVTRAFLLVQLIMLLLLIPRFWQRGMAVSYWQRRMLVPVAEVRPVEPTVISAAPVPAPAFAVPATPNQTPGPEQDQ